jgi:hypothetical protein
MADPKVLFSGRRWTVLLAVSCEAFSVAGNAGWSGAYRVVMLGFSSL